MGAKETVGTALRSSLEKRKIEGKMETVKMNELQNSDRANRGIQKSSGDLLSLKPY